VVPQGAHSTRSHGSQPSCFLAYLRRGFVRRTKNPLLSYFAPGFRRMVIGRPVSKSDLLIAPEHFWISFKPKRSQGRHYPRKISTK
jgi:hypothetical protein